MYGSGALAGLAAGFGFTALKSLPSIVSGTYLGDIGRGAAMISIGLGAIAGFVQSRSGFNIVSQGAEAAMAR